MGTCLKHEKMTYSVYESLMFLRLRTYMLLYSLQSRVEVLKN